MPAAKKHPELKDFVRTKNDSMRALLQTVEKVLDHDVNVFILGESGVGKDYFAEAIHSCGKRREKPLVRIDCAAIPADLFEAEIFGFEKGTFTDAVARKAGKLEMAHGGTVYFDAVTALTANLQAKLLRAIQDKSFTRLGGHEAISFDARIVSSSSTAVESLRNDLLYRINVVTLTIPPLRERREDIPQRARRAPAAGETPALLPPHRAQAQRSADHEHRTGLLRVYAPVVVDDHRRIRLTDRFRELDGLPQRAVGIDRVKEPIFTVDVRDAVAVDRRPVDAPLESSRTRRRP